MSGHYRRCQLGSKDCFDCPFEDCIATADDINRQDAEDTARRREERAKKVVKLWNEGQGRYTAEDIAKLYGMSPTGILSMLRTQEKKGVYVWRSERSRKQRRK